MSFFQAIAYFAREAFLNLLRSWKVSLVAVLTIAVSLFLAGTFLLVSGNLRGVVDRWRGESKIVIYLEPDAAPESRQRLRHELESARWTLQVEVITTEVAERRFREAFPSMADLLEGQGADPLPASLEVSLDWSQLEGSQALDVWAEELRADRAIAMVDDDRDWLGQLQAVILVIEGLGIVVGAILLVTAMFTISSVIRLTAYLYRDEIAVMRLVGATEFFIRGPFYFEGMFQGLAGGTLAATTLLGAHALMVQQNPDAVVTSFLAAEFLSFQQLLFLIALGGLAGLVGAVSSLRREDLGPAAGQ